MVLADLGRKITSALQSLSKATVINEEVSESRLSSHFAYLIHSHIDFDGLLFLTALLFHRF